MPAKQSENQRSRSPKRPAPAASQGSSRPAASRGQVTPVKQLVSSAEATPPAVGSIAVLCPKLIDDPDEAGVLSNMRAIIPYVVYHLREQIRAIPSLARQFADAELHVHAPLDIKAVTDLRDDELRSFKHPWNSVQAEASLRGTSMYESAGNLVWCDPMPPLSGDEKIIAGSLPTWADLQEIANAAFSLESAKSLAVPETEKKSAFARLVFRSPIVVIVKDIEGAKADHFKSALKVLTEYASIWAWYKSMFEAINTKNVDWIAALWQAALCVTLHMRVGMSIEDQAVLSMTMSDQRKQEARLSDSFMGFALKALLVLRAHPECKQGSEMSKVLTLQCELILYVRIRINFTIKNASAYPPPQSFLTRQVGGKRSQL